MSEYRVDVRPFLDEIGGGVEIDDTLDLAELTVGDERFVMLEPPSFRVNLSNAGEAFVAVGKITAEVRARCSRCLADFETTLTGEVEGLWPRPGHDFPEEEDVTGEVDSELKIDLEPALIAALVVDAPFAPLHDEECAGLCPTCGHDLNAGPCECSHVDQSDNPFAALRGLTGPDAPESGGTGGS